MAERSRSTGPKTEYYESIDGNPLRCPVAYCTYYHGYLSENIIRVHRCRKKHGGACSRLQNMRGENVKQMRQDQYFDKMLTRLEKIETALNRIGRILGAMQQKPDKDAEEVHKYAEGEKE